MTCVIRNNVFKVKSKYLIFKTSIAEVKTYLLVDNKSEAKLIDEFFMHANKISIFKLENFIDFILRNGEIVQQFTKRAFVNIIIRDYIEQMVCYLAKLDIYTIILDHR